MIENLLRHWGKPGGWTKEKRLAEREIMLLIKLGLESARMLGVLNPA
jgi:hypothetical protein